MSSLVQLQLRLIGIYSLVWVMDPIMNNQKLVGLDEKQNTWNSSSGYWMNVESYVLWIHPVIQYMYIYYSGSTVVDWQSTSETKKPTINGKASQLPEQKGGLCKLTHCVCSVHSHTGLIKNRWCLIYFSSRTLYCNFITTSNMLVLRTGFITLWFCALWLKKQQSRE